jgi:hypothetical protein
MGMNANEFFQGRYFKVGDLEGGERTLEISGVERAEFGDDIKPALLFKDEKKALVLNKTNMEMVVELAGTPSMDNWSGIRISLFPDTVRFNGAKVPCIRVKKAEEVEVPF